MRRLLAAAPGMFQSTLPVGGATLAVNLLVLSSLFQSTLPVGGATPTLSSGWIVEDKFQSTLPVGGATSWAILANSYARNVSIHAPRGGSDSVNITT